MSDASKPVRRRAKTPLHPGRWPLTSTLGRILAGALLMLALNAEAMEPRDFESPEQEQRFNALTEELRCTVCQNQSLADSDVPLAEDLRDQIQIMIEQGKSDDDIKQFLVSRYGEFVLYRPPVGGNTLLLWLAPVLLLSFGAVIMGATIRRRRVMLAEEVLDETHAERATDKLKDASERPDTRTDS